MLRNLNIILKRILSREGGSDASDPQAAGETPSGVRAVAAREDATAAAPVASNEQKAAFHMGRGEWQAAIEEWNQAAEKAIGRRTEKADMRRLFAWSKLQVAVCQWHLEAYAQSYLTLRLTVAFDRRILSLRETWLLRARLTGLVSKERSAAYLARGVAMFPDDHALMFEYVKYLIALERWKAAQDNVEILQAMNPSDPPVQEMMRKIQQRNGAPGL